MFFFYMLAGLTVFIASWNASEANTTFGASAVKISKGVVGQ